MTDTPPRRTYSETFKHALIEACGAPGASVVGVALENGVNAHLLRRLAARVARMIRVEALWLSAAPLDMRAGMDTLLAHMVRVFGEARAHHAYLFANLRGTRMKVLVHDGQGIWLACRRLH